MNRLNCIVALLTFLCFASPKSDAQIVSSLFTTSTEGWTWSNWNNGFSSINSTDPVSYNATGGNPGGYISFSQSTNNRGFFTASSAFLGNKLSAYGGSLTFSQKDTNVDAGSVPLVILKGAGLRLYFDGTPPGTGWTDYSVGLGITGWRVNDPNSGSAVTVSQLQSVLASLDGVYIFGDWNNGPDNTGLDSVKMFAGAVPEPGPVAFGISAIVAGLVMVRKRRMAQRR